MPIVTIDQLHNLLTNLPPETKIQLQTTPHGEIQVIEAAVLTDKRPPRTKDDILKENYADLIGRPISASKAAEKYGVNRRTIHNWKKQGFIEVLEDSYTTQLNEADIAYVVDIYRERKQAGTLSGAPLLDDDGLPYQLKHLTLSKQRRRKKENAHDN